MQKTIGMTGQKPANTRDFGPKFSGVEKGSSRKAKNGNTHIQGRPLTRNGQETDRRA